MTLELNGKCMTMRTSTRLLAGLFGLLLLNTAARAEQPRRQPFDAGWEFHFGDTPGAEAAGFNDAGWTSLSVPHDWMIAGPKGRDPAAMEGPFDPHSPGGAGNGYLDGGVGWYRKHFKAPAGGHVAIEFDGVYMNAHVWINGHDLGVHPYGYTSFEYDLTPYLKKDADNLLAVRTEVIQPCSRFYSGGGIYRHVWLTRTDAVHIAHWGTYVTDTVDSGTAKVTAKTTVANDGATPASVTVESVILNPNGTDTAHTESASLSVAAGKSADVVPVIDIANPTLWSIENPAMYALRSTVKLNGKIVDTYTTPFGLRTLKFTINDGFFLNGKHVPIRGVCDHHDLGVLGAAVNTRAIERQLQLLKAMGCNGIRTSHYPPAPELLDLCDKLGFVVMDEAFDEWKLGKTSKGYGQYFDQYSEGDITSMIHRDRNHPSVILWSIGNEIPEQHNKKVAESMSTRLVDICRREDPTRLTTSAMDTAGNAVTTGFSKPLGVFGVNYHLSSYNDSRMYKKMPMIGSETASALSSRGEYGLAVNDDGAVFIREEFDHQCSDYDVLGPKWGNRAEDALLAQQNDPWMAGEFVWTGFDYIGEPTPYNWPSRSSYFGIMDLCGFRKDRFYLYQSQWTTAPMVHVLPHWNWPQFAGKEIPVWCYSNAESVELLLNGKSLGRKTRADRNKLHFEWKVPFAPGTLKAVAKNGDQVVASDEVTTAGKPASLTLTADRTALKRGIRDQSFLTAGAIDDAGHRCPMASDLVHYTVTGPASVVGVGNGDPINHEPFQAQQHKLFNGMGLGVVQTGDDCGAVTITASADGLKPASVTLNVGE